MVYFNSYIKFIKCHISEESPRFKVHWIGTQDAVVSLVSCNRSNAELTTSFIRIKGSSHKH